MAITDALTGLYNRRYMESHLSALVEQAAARGKPLTALVLDIDYFKAINDTHGHDAGDDVLREFAVRVRKSIRGIDLACRYGGEEFVIIMPETDMAVATIVAERLRRRIAVRGVPDQPGRRRDRGDDLDRHCHARRGRRQRRLDPQARRPGALSRQARRPQPRGRRRGVKFFAREPLARNTSIAAAAFALPTCAVDVPSTRRATLQRTRQVLSCPD